MINLAKYNKFFVAASAAAGVICSSLVSGHITTNDWWAMAIAVLGALGVHLVPNATDTDTAPPAPRFQRRHPHHQPPRMDTFHSLLGESLPHAHRLPLFHAVLSSSRALHPHHLTAIAYVCDRPRCQVIVLTIVTLALWIAGTLIPMLN